MHPLRGFRGITLDGVVLGGLKLQVFTHPACPGCGPVVEMAWKVAESHESVELQTVKLETEDGLSLAQASSIRTIPSVVLIVDGEEVERFAGTPEPDSLREAVEGILED